MVDSMQLKFLKSKLHNVTCTFTNVEYNGSVTIDRDLMDQAGMFANEAVLVADVDNGKRFETYVIPGERGSGVIGVNGSAAHLTAVGHRLIIMAFCYLTPDEVKRHAATVVLVDRKNDVTAIEKNASVE
jgi:aspartate 1-decarboxylase